MEKCLLLGNGGREAVIAENISKTYQAKNGEIEALKNEKDAKSLERLHNIKEERTNEDLVYEIMLKYGIDLTLPIEKHNNISYNLNPFILLNLLNNAIIIK